MSKMSVCYATSDEFTIHTGISLLSLLDNNRGVVDRAFILDYGMTDASKQKVQDICDKYEVQCVFVWAKDKLVEIGEKTNIKNFRDSFATYSRAFLDCLLPLDVDKVLYIDSDSTVIGSVAPIMDIDMTDKVICGCPAAGFYGHKKNGKDRATRELDTLLTKNKFYIQCGVLWYSLKNWRRFGCLDMIVAATKQLERYPFADQTLINNSLPDKWFATLPLKYNLTSHSHCHKYNIIQYRGGGFYSDADISEALNTPVIIHYCGSSLFRPWYERCYSRRKEHYLYYKQMSAWKDVPLQTVPEPTSFKGKMSLRLFIAGMKSDSYLWCCVLSKIRRFLFE